ncbi:premelanosome protein a [Alosa sapidissima]|uniref:premelanosome protein a n=1 Tax=Alosa sapidissima TaxID=34773 RepID=UPI001C097A4D|nr:premelanosome protein a [Alosa sapidissima]
MRTALVVLVLTLSALTVADAKTRFSRYRSWNSRMYPVWRDGDSRYRNCWKGGEVTFDVRNDAPTLTGAKATFNIDVRFPPNQTLLDDGQVVWARNCTVDGTEYQAGQPVYAERNTPDEWNGVFPDGSPYRGSSGRKPRYIYVWKTWGRFWQVADGPASFLTIGTDNVPLGSYNMEVVIYHCRGKDRFIPLGYASTQFSITDQIPFRVAISQVNDVNQADQSFVQNRAVSFNINLHDPSQYLSSSDVAFTWDFGDNSGTLITRENTVTHTYVSAGAFRPQVVLMASIPNTCDPNPTIGGATVQPTLPPVDPDTTGDDSLVPVEEVSAGAAPAADVPVPTEAGDIALAVPASAAPAAEGAVVDTDAAAADGATVDTAVDAAAADADAAAATDTAVDAAAADAATVDAAAADAATVDAAAADPATVDAAAADAATVDAAAADAATVDAAAADAATVDAAAADAAAADAATVDAAAADVATVDAAAADAAAADATAAAADTEVAAAEAVDTATVTVAEDPAVPVAEATVVPVAEMAADAEAVAVDTAVVDADAAVAGEDVTVELAATVLPEAPAAEDAAVAVADAAAVTEVAAQAEAEGAVADVEVVAAPTVAVVPVADEDEVIVTVNDAVATEAAVIAAATPGENEVVVNVIVTAAPVPPTVAAVVNEIGAEVEVEAGTEVAQVALVIAKRQAPELPPAENGCNVFRYGSFSTDLQIVQGIENAEIVEVNNVVTLATEVDQNAVDLTITCQGSLPSEVCTVVSGADCATPVQTVCNAVAPAPECQMILRQFFNDTGIFCINVSLTNDVSLAVASAMVSVTAGPNSSAGGAIGAVMGILVLACAVGIIGLAYRRFKQYRPLTEDSSDSSGRTSVPLLLWNLLSRHSAGESRPLLQGRVV